MDHEGKQRALQAIEFARAIVAASPARAIDDEARELLQKAGDRIQQANAAFALAVVRDEWAPASMFTAWASVRRIRDWGKAKHIAVKIKHGRACVRPSDFFRHFATMGK